MSKFSKIFHKHLVDNVKVAVKGDCPCGAENVRMIKGKCYKCYQVEYCAKRKADRDLYKF